MTSEPERPTPPAEIRRKAEAQARQQPPESLANLSLEQITKVLHELHVHQIELEMQNEELRRAQTELETARSRYFDLYELAPVGYVSLCDQGLIQEVNLTAATLLGKTCASLHKQPLTSFIIPEDQHLYYLNRKHSMEYFEPRSCELRMIHPDGAIFWAHLVFTTLGQNDGPPVCRVALTNVTKHKMVAEALRESEERYRFLFESASDALFLMTADSGRIVKANRMASMLYGYSPEELLALHCMELSAIPGEKCLCITQALLAPGENQHIPMHLHRKKDGTILLVEITARTMTLEGQQGIFIAVRDITESKQMEEALRESEERYRVLFESASDALYLVAGDSNLIIKANRRASELYGYDPEELLSKTGIDLSAEPDKSRRIFFEAMANPDLIVSVPLRLHRKKDGTIFPVEITGRSIPFLGQQTILIASRDITERQQSEKALRESEDQRLREQQKANAQLKEQAENLASIYQALDSVGLIVCDLLEDDARINIFNRGAEKLFGWRREEVIGQSIACIYPPENVHIMGGRVETLRKGESIQSFDMTLFRKSGERFPAVISLHPFDRHEDQYRKAVGCIRDISELIGVQTQLKAMNEDLEKRVEQRTRELQETQKQYLHAEKLTAIGKLSASIAHEFNNPLQGILSILKGLKKRAIMEKEDRDLLDAAIGESDRIKDLIRNLQDFNRPSTGRKTLFDVHESLNSVLLLQKSDFKSKRITVELNYAERLPRILAVPDQIKQVFLNLLTNAADACQVPGGIITISTSKEGDRVAIAIKDTGIGIKPEEMDMIFQPFFTTKPTVKGTGLGLSVSYGIVKKHQGEIRVDSSPRHGATFTIVLPIGSVRESDAAREE